MQDKFLKLTNAVYNVLEFFPESDPLKNKAKDKALAIMENPAPEDIDILLGYLQIAKSQGWLNSVNYLIIANEYEKLRIQVAFSVISAKAKIQSEATFLDSRFRGNDISSRQKKIIEFLSKNGKAQVMDLQAVLPDVTKRTIRRDLDELLNMGRIARLGEFNQVFYKAIEHPTTAS